MTPPGVATCPSPRYFVIVRHVPPVEECVSEIPEPVRTALDGLRSLGGDDLVRQMAAVFIEYSGGRIRALHGAAEAGDLVTCAEAAHALKGSARQLGLLVMADACAAAEMAGKQGDAAAARIHAAAVQESYTTAVEWLKAATA